MQVSLNQSFEDSRTAVDNYFAYISRQNDARKEQSNDLSHSLDSVVEGVNAVGTVAAMAAKESMQSHNTIFGMLKMMNAEQRLLTKMIVEIKRNGGGGSADGSVLGEALGGMVESVAITSAIENILLNLGITGMPQFALPAMAALGMLKGASDQDDKNKKQSHEHTHPNSLTNKALAASAEAERFINGAYHSLSLNPAPNPLMNGPAIFKDGIRKEDLPFTETFGDTMTVVAAVYEANALLEEAGHISSRPRIRDDYSPNDEYSNLMRHNGIEPDAMTYGLNTEYDHLMRYNSETAIAALSPQPAQVIVQAPPPSAEPPNQTVTVHMNNNINGSFFDSRGFQDISDYLVKRIKEQLSSRGVRPSHDR